MSNTRANTAQLPIIAARGITFRPAKAARWPSTNGARMPPVSAKVKIPLK